MKWNMFSKDKPKGDLNLLIVQPLKELARLGDILEKINNKNMETKEIKIVPPEGYEIDKENSTFECVKFKPIEKVSTYEDVAKKLFFGKSFFFVTTFSEIEKSEGESKIAALEANNCTSHKQAEKLLAINKLMNVAKYLNGDWKPDWEDTLQQKFYIKQGIEEHINVSCVTMTNDINVFFKSEEAAQQAISILGEETIKLALSTDW